jgi:hypothetical protein
LGKNARRFGRAREYRFLDFDIGLSYFQSSVLFCKFLLYYGGVETVSHYVYLADFTHVLMFFPSLPINYLFTTMHHMARYKIFFSTGVELKALHLLLRCTTTDPLCQSFVLCVFKTVSLELFS